MGCQELKNNFCRFPSSNSSPIGAENKKAFTLAEVLITLVVIGIIAAITVPMIHANYKKQETAAKLKKTYSELSQLIKRSQLDNGPVTEWYENSNKDPNTMYANCIKPYLRDTKKTTSYKNALYNSEQPYKKLSGAPYYMSIGISQRHRTSFLMNNTVFAMIMTATLKNDEYEKLAEPLLYLDINAGKKPNQLGKDVFIMKINSKKGLVAECHTESTPVVNANCTKTNDGKCCLEKIMRDGWQIKSNYPW